MSSKTTAATGCPRNARQGQRALCWASRPLLTLLLLFPLHIAQGDYLPAVGVCPIRWAKDPLPIRYEVLRKLPPLFMGHDMVIETNKSTVSLATRTNAVPAVMPNEPPAPIGMSTQPNNQLKAPPFPTIEPGNTPPIDFVPPVQLRSQSSSATLTAPSGVSRAGSTP